MKKVLQIPWNHGNQHPQLKFVVCPQATHYDSIQDLCTILSMFYPLQSFGYKSRLISSNLCMLSLLGLNYVGSEHDTDHALTPILVSSL